MDGEDQGTSQPQPDDDWSPDDTDHDGLRGWISPDDRLWRHPSESAALIGGGPSGTAPASGATTASGTAPAAGPVRPRPAPWVVGGATVCFVLVLVVAGVMVATAGDGDHPGSPTLQSMVAPMSTTAGTGSNQLPSSATVKALVADVSPSTVAVVSTGSWGTTENAGLVVASGVIVTTAASVARSRSLTVIEANGTRQPGKVIGADRSTGLTLISVADDLVAATPDDVDPASGSVAIAMSLGSPRASGVAPTVSVYAGRVISTGTTVSADKETESFTSTAIEASLPSSDVGCPLVDGRGHVVGLLEAVTDSDGSSVSVFLPADLVFGVAQQLLTTGSVEHGSLGAEATDAEPPSDTTAVGGALGAGAGARLVSVDSDGPAADAGLQSGDVITGAGGGPVHSLAELDTRLYAEAPGATVSLSFSRSGSSGTTEVTLATGDADASAVSSSP